MKVIPIDAYKANRECCLTCKHALVKEESSFPGVECLSPHEASEGEYKSGYVGWGLVNKYRCEGWEHK